MSGSEFKRERDEAANRGILPQYFENPEDPVLGTTDPIYRGIIGGAAGQRQVEENFPERGIFRESDLRDYYLGLSVEDQKRFAQVLFARDHMDKADIVEIEDIYDPLNVAIGMEHAAQTAAFNMKMGTEVYDEGIPTLGKGFQDFTQEEFEGAVQEFLDGEVGAAIDPALVEEMFKSTYGSETGEVASAKETKAFMKGIYAKNKDLSLQELSARAKQSIRANPQNQKLLKVMDKAKAVDKVRSLITQL
tara:strand:+ start:9287 stop:10030 length:744 start_codon:yes stop_codon:yes gene_type:complete